MLPLFDTIFDTFDSLRSRSTFCLTAILSVATKLSVSGQGELNHVQELCQEESKKLAAETLFDGGAQLETIQGMVVLAAYSRRCWYAVGHAVRLAQQMELSKSLPSLLSMQEDAAGHKRDFPKGVSKRLFLLRRQVSVWMTLAHLEQEIASLTGRRSLIERDSNLKMRHMIDTTVCPDTEHHILGAMEFLQLRSEFSLCCNTLNRRLMMLRSISSSDRLVECYGGSVQLQSLDNDEHAR